MILCRTREKWLGDLSDKDPELAVGEEVTLERADGRRAVWRQRYRVGAVSANHYHLVPVEVT